MKISLEWLKEFAPDLSTAEEVVSRLTLTGTKVESVTVEGSDIVNVVTGRVTALADHPDADQLKVCQVLIDETGKSVQIVTGAPNIKNGVGVIVALEGACLPGGKCIDAVIMRGVRSEGMLCSIQELGFDLHDFPGAVANGLYLLEETVPLGVDIREYLGLNQTCLEFEITPNRSDCLSAQGIAREAAVSLEQNYDEYAPKVLQTNNCQIEGKYNVAIETGTPCSQFALKYVQNVKVKPSPLWLRRYLRSVGIRPINNVVDITNYVMIALGQPLHAYDAAKVSGDTLIARLAKDGENVTTLDQELRQLDQNTIVIADNSCALGIAGIMGGADTQVTDKTVDILLEAASFSAESVRNTSKRFVLRTEASTRFEKGICQNNVLTALDYAAELFEQIGAGEPSTDTINCCESIVAPTKISFRWSDINNLLGTDLSPLKIEAILQSLGFAFSNKTDQEATVIVPPWRLDVAIVADLVEEVARIYGYNEIKPTLRCGQAITLGGLSKSQIWRRSITSFMTGEGYLEAITFSFESPSVTAKLGLSNESLPFSPVIIRNPLGEDYSQMRYSVWPSLFQLAKTNQSKGNNSGNLFELMKTYHFDEIDSDSAIPVETLHLAGVTWISEKNKKGALFFDAKGVIERLLKNLRMPKLEALPLEVSYLHPGQAAVLVCGGIFVGSIGLIHPKTAEIFDLDEQTVVFDIEIDRLLSLSYERSALVLPTKFPSMIRDLALVVPSSMPASKLEHMIEQYGGKLLKEIKLIDIFEGGNLAAQTKSLTFKLTYRHLERTLTDIEVADAMELLRSELATLGIHRRN